jgi:hypothetical protein
MGCLRSSRAITSDTMDPLVRHAVQSEGHTRTAFPCFLALAPVQTAWPASNDSAIVVNVPSLPRPLPSGVRYASPGLAPWVSSAMRRSTWA